MVIRTMPAGIRELPSAFQPEKKKADRFYDSPEWRSLMKALIAQRGRRCEECGKTGSRVYGDHIHELQDGGAPLDPLNVLIRCASCHSSKTLTTRAMRLGTIQPMMPSRQRY
jgi:5-methylcytosine-specific restriction endonuclease McrA